MRKVFFVGQADRAFPGLPFWTKVRAADKLKDIAGTSDEHAPGTLGVVGTRLRYFQLEGFLFTYSAPRARDRILWVLKISRKS